MIIYINLDLDLRQMSILTYPKFKPEPCSRVRYFSGYCHFVYK